MTNEESIETIKNMDTSEFGDAVHQALNMAIEALEKQIDGKFHANIPDETIGIKSVCPFCEEAIEDKEMNDFNELIKRIEGNDDDEIHGHFDPVERICDTCKHRGIDPHEEPCSCCKHNYTSEYEDENCMNNKEAIEFALDYDFCNDCAINLNKESFTDKCIGCEKKYFFELAEKALEKQIPIKPIKSRKNWYLCPKCKVEEFMFTDNEKPSDYTKFCSACGQAFDWSDYEEETEKR